MIVVVDHIKTDKDSGVLIYRRKFPKDLVPFVPGKNTKGRGRIEYKKSLRAKSMGTPGVAARLQEAQDEFNELVRVAERQRSTARKRASGTHDPLDASTIARIAAHVFHEGLAIHEEVFTLPEPIERKRYRVAAFSETIPKDLAEAREFRALGDRASMVAIWGDEAASLAEAEGLFVDRSSESFALLCSAVNDAQIAAWEGSLRRLQGDAIPTPPYPSAPRAAEVPNVASDNTFHEIAQSMMESVATPLGHATISSWSTALRFFREVHGQPLTTMITRKHVTEWIELLAQRPSKVPKCDQKLSMKALAEKYATSDVPRMSRKTLRVHLASLATVWNKGQERGLIPEDLANPFKARKSLATSAEEDEGTEFSMDELQAIFALPVFTSGERRPQGRGEACYWMPLILMTTGVRPEEAAQLLVSDFYQDEDSRQWMLTITDEGDHPVKGSRRLKSGRRRFPVPQQLIDLGLITYVEHLRTKREVALFPQLTVQSEAKGYLTPSIGKWWSAYLKENNVLLLPQKGKTRRPYRDFRTCWATAARTARVPEEAMSYLMGHSNAGAVTTRSYGGKHPHASWMLEVKFPKLDLSQVRPWTA